MHTLTVQHFNNFVLYNNDNFIFIYKWRTGGLHD